MGTELLHCNIEYGTAARANMGVKTAMVQACRKANPRAIRRAAGRFSRHPTITHKPLGAYEIIDRLAVRGPRPAPITAYRALEFLRENGLVQSGTSLG
jgi:hypothetical protein